ncbi:MAG: ion transporter [Gammaproteobacteria bacterium]
MPSDHSADSPKDEALAYGELCPGPVERLRRRIYLALEVRSQDDRLGQAADIALFILIALNVAAVLGESVASFNERYHSIFVVFEAVSVAIFSAEYVSRVWVSIDQPRFADVGANWVKRLKYMASPMALIDLVAVLPFYLALTGLLGGMDMRILRTLRLARILKLSRHSEAMTLLLRVLKENGRNFSAALGILLIVMIITASGIHLFENEAQPEAFGSIPAAMWWAFATLTTVGYGDVTPITVGGKVFGAAITVVSVGIVALPAGILASSFSERLRLKTKSYRELADKAYADGLLTADEYAQLEAERKKLGIGEDLAAAILKEEQSGEHGDTHCPRCGVNLSSPPPDENRDASRG